MAKDSTAELRSLLRSAARKPPARGETLYSKVRSLYPEILELKKNGYTDSEIHELFLSKGEKASLGTLRQYFQRAAKEWANEGRTDVSQGATALPPKTHTNAKPNANGALKPSQTIMQSSVKSSDGRRGLGHRLNDDDA
jgi:hypothetical protein